MQRERKKCRIMFLASIMDLNPALPVGIFMIFAPATLPMVQYQLLSKSLLPPLLLAVNRRTQFVYYCFHSAVSIYLSLAGCRSTMPTSWLDIQALFLTATTAAVVQSNHFVSWFHLNLRVWNQVDVDQRCPRTGWAYLPCFLQRCRAHCWVLWCLARQEAWVYSSSSALPVL